MMVSSTLTLIAVILKEELQQSPLRLKRSLITGAILKRYCDATAGMFADINEAAYFQYRPIAGIEDATSLCLVDFHANTTGVRHGDGVPFFDDHSESRQLASGALDSPEKHTVKARRMLRRKGNGNIIPQKFESFFPVLLQKIAAPDSDKAGNAPENAECFFLLSGAIVS